MQKHYLMGIGVSIFNLWVLYLGIYNYVQAGTETLTMQDFLNKPMNESTMGKTLQAFTHGVNLSLPDSELPRTFPFVFSIQLEWKFLLDLIPDPP